MASLGEVSIIQTMDPIENQNILRRCLTFVQTALDIKCLWEFHRSLEPRQTDIHFVSQQRYISIIWFLMPEKWEYMYPIFRHWKLVNGKILSFQSRQGLVYWDQKYNYSKFWNTSQLIYLHTSIMSTKRLNSVLLSKIVHQIQNISAWTLMRYDKNRNIRTFNI